MKLIYGSTTFLMCAVPASAGRTMRKVLLCHVAKSGLCSHTPSFLLPAYDCAGAVAYVHFRKIDVRFECRVQDHLATDGSFFIS